MTGVPAAKIEENDRYPPRLQRPVHAGRSQERYAPGQGLHAPREPARPAGVRVMVEPKRFYTRGPWSPTSSASSVPSTERIRTLAKQRLRAQRPLEKPASKPPTRTSCAASPATGRSKPMRPGARSASSTRNRQPRAAMSSSQSTSTSSARGQFVKEGLGASKNAAAIVMDVHTGEILSLVSWPPTTTTSSPARVDEQALNQLLNDPGKPLSNHAITEQYAPGSTFKQITGLAALQEGIATANTQITCLGYSTWRTSTTRNQVHRSKTGRRWAA